MGLLELQLSGNPELLEEHLATRRIRFPWLSSAGLFNDSLCIDAGELDGDGGIRRLFTNTNLTYAGGPAPAAPQDFLAFTAGNRRLDGAMIQCREPLGVEGAERLHTGHERRQQQGFYQTVVVAERRALGLIVGETLEVLTSPMLFFQQR